LVITEETKAKVQEMLHILDQDITTLTLNADPIRALLKQLPGQIPDKIEAYLVPAAYIE
jgi:hypothetical protein